jgi:hypothetical protein
MNPYNNCAYTFTSCQHQMFKTMVHTSNWIVYFSMSMKRLHKPEQLQKRKLACNNLAKNYYFSVTYLLR